MMTQVEYENALRAALGSQRQQILEKLTGAIENLPEKAIGFDIGIHPDQDQEGFLGVWIHVTGPDLYVLNKAIERFRELFEIKLEGTNMSFGLPMFNPYGEDFPVGDIQVDTVQSWLCDLWPALHSLNFEKPVTVFGADGFGPLKPLKLN